MRLHRTGIIALALLAGCGGDDPPSDADRAREAATRYVHTNANNEDAECAKLVTKPGLCGDQAPLGTRVNPEATKAEVTGTKAKVTVTGAAQVLIDVDLVKQGDDWKVSGWRGYAPGDAVE